MLYQFYHQHSPEVVMMTPSLDFHAEPTWQHDGLHVFCVQETVQSLGDPLEALMGGSISSVEFSGGQVICNAARRNRVYLPGSFNPLHDGHR